MKRFVLVTILFCIALVANASTASARYYYRRPVARAAARVALPPYGVVGPRVYYGPRYYNGPRYYGYGPRFYGYGPGWYGPRAYVGFGVY
jgi:hypothetical protein